MRPAAVALLPVAALSLVLAGCAGDSGLGSVSDGTSSTDAAQAVVTVDVGPDACDVSTASTTSGAVAFVVTNSGSSDATFTFYAQGNDPIGEMKDLAPGATKTLLVEDVVAADDYVTGCAPTSDDDEIRADFSVTQNPTASP